MSFRQRLTLIFSLTVLLCVVAVAWIVFALARRALEQANDKSSAALVAQFHREFDRQKGEIISTTPETLRKASAWIFWNL